LNWSVVSELSDPADGTLIDRKEERIMIIDGYKFLVNVRSWFRVKCFMGEEKLKFEKVCMRAGCIEQCNIFQSRSEAN
jgi:hypothetical protein